MKREMMLSKLMNRVELLSSFTFFQTLELMWKKIFFCLGYVIMNRNYWPCIFRFQPRVTSRKDGSQNRPSIKFTIWFDCYRVGFTVPLSLMYFRTKTIAYLSFPSSYLWNRYQWQAQRWMCKRSNLKLAPTASFLYWPSDVIPIFTFLWPISTRFLLLIGHQELALLVHFPYNIMMQFSVKLCNRSCFQ